MNNTTQFAKVFVTSIGQALMYVDRCPETEHPMNIIKAVVNGSMVSIERVHNENTKESMQQALYVVEGMDAKLIEFIIREELEEEGYDAILDGPFEDTDTKSEKSDKSLNPDNYPNTYEGACQALKDAKARGLGDEEAEMLQGLIEAVKHMQDMEKGE